MFNILAFFKNPFLLPNITPIISPLSIIKNYDLERQCILSTLIGFYCFFSPILSLLFSQHSMTIWSRARQAYSFYHSKSSNYGCHRQFLYDRKRCLEFQKGVLPVAIFQSSQFGNCLRGQARGQHHPYLTSSMVRRLIRRSSELTKNLVPNEPTGLKLWFRSHKYALTVCFQPKGSKELLKPL